MAEMTRDFNSVFLAHLLLATAAHAEDTETSATAKLTWGCRSGAFLMEIGNIDASATINMTFQHSPDGTTWTDLVPIGYSSADIDITDAAGLGEDNVIAFAVDELFEGGYVRCQHLVAPDSDNTCVFGVTFIGFRAMERPIFTKWAGGETYVVDEVVQNDGYYFKCILAFTMSLAESEVLNESYLSEPGVGASTGTYWEIYKGVAL